MKNKNGVVAAGVTLALLATSTYAWTDMKQHKTNTAAGLGADYRVSLVDIFNPEEAKEWKPNQDLDKEVYVVNKGEPGDGDIFVRIKLREYMEIGAGRSYEYTDERYLIDNEGRFVTSTSQEDLKSHLESMGVDVDKDRIKLIEKSVVNDEARYFYQTDFGDINGQYGKHLELSRLSDHSQIGKRTPVIKGSEYQSSDEHNEDLSNHDKYPVLNHDESNAIRDYIKSPLADDNFIHVDDIDGESPEAGTWIVSGEYAYWSQPLSSGEKTSKLIDGLSLVNEPDGEFYYDLHVHLEAVDETEIGTWTDMPETIRDIVVAEREKARIPELRWFYQHDLAVTAFAVDDKDNTYSISEDGIVLSYDKDKNLRWKYDAEIKEEDLIKGNLNGLFLTDSGDLYINIFGDQIRKRELRQLDTETGEVLQEGTPIMTSVMDAGFGYYITYDQSSSGYMMRYDGTGEKLASPLSTTSFNGGRTVGKKVDNTIMFASPFNESSAVDMSLNEKGEVVGDFTTAGRDNRHKYQKDITKVGDHYYLAVSSPESGQGSSILKLDKSFSIVDQTTIPNSLTVRSIDPFDDGLVVTDGQNIRKLSLDLELEWTEQVTIEQENFNGVIVTSDSDYIYVRTTNGVARLDTTFKPYYRPKQ